jgi:hypothetical protein
MAASVPGSYAPVTDTGATIRRLGFEAILHRFDEGGRFVAIDNPVIDDDDRFIILAMAMALP